MSLRLGILDGNVRHLKDLHWKRQRPVLPSRFEHTGEEGRTNDLIFERFGVGEGDGVVTGIWAIEVGKVFIMRALY